MHYTTILSLGAVTLFALGAGCVPTTTTTTTLNTNSSEVVSEVVTTDAIAVPPLEEKPVATTKIFNVSELAELDAHFNFSVEIPAQWEVEPVAEIQAINFYDPAASGDTNLDKSQIFVRYFLAQEFLTLNTVTIHSSTALTINGHEAVEYDIEKQASVADFIAQPAWRNQRHIVTDIRVSTNSLVFYVFGQRPELDQATLDQFFQSLDIVE